MRARDSQGNFRPDFSPYSWGRDYAECSAIQATLGVLHDIPGLIQLMGGKEAFSNYLLKTCQVAPLFETTGYGYEIHEMSEMATAPFGQIAISNQPSFHIPYLFRYSDYPDYTALLIKTLRQKLFTQVGKRILAMRITAVSRPGTSGQLSDFIRPVQENQAMTSNTSL